MAACFTCFESVAEAIFIIYVMVCVFVCLAVERRPVLGPKTFALYVCAGKIEEELTFQKKYKVKVSADSRSVGVCTWLCTSLLRAVVHVPMFFV